MEKVAVRAIFLFGAQLYWKFVLMYSILIPPEVSLIYWCVINNKITRKRDKGREMKEKDTAAGRQPRG